MSDLTHRLRLDNSIVSMSMTWICLKPMRAKFFSNSQPNPPAPMTNSLQFSIRNWRVSGDGSKSGRQNGPDRSNIFLRWLHRLCVWSDPIIVFVLGKQRSDARGGSQVFQIYLVWCLSRRARWGRWQSVGDGREGWDWCPTLRSRGWQCKLEELECDRFLSLTIRLEAWIEQTL